ncbi:MAG: hypothetical protein WHV63_07155 [Ignavibacteria bacterium]|nr:hypothetical protein [Ignavibacteria bacterium]
MKKLLYLPIIILTFLITCNSNPSQEKEPKYLWQYLTTTLWYDVYYDYKSIGIYDNEIVLFLKYVPLESAKDKVISMRKRANVDDPDLVKKYENFAYSIQIHFWDCENKLNAIWAFEDYDKDDNLITYLYTELDSLVYFNVEGDLYGETMLKAICKLKAEEENRRKSKDK